MESILNSTKKKIGIGEDYTHFDEGDIIDHINSVFGDLNQLGVGPEEGFSIEDATAIWDDFLSDNVKLNSVKTYMFLRLKLIFDPPKQSSVIACYEKQIEKLEWRLNVAAEEETTD